MNVFNLFFWITLTFFSSSSLFSITFSKNKNMMKAVNKNQIEKVKELIQKGADINYVDKKSGETALTVAIANNYKELVSYLLQKNIKKTTPNYRSLTPLMIASTWAKDDVFDLVIGDLSKEELNTLSRSSKNALHFALQEKKLKHAQKLIKKGVDYLRLDKYGISPMHLIIENNYKNLLKEILDTGYNVNYQDPLKFEFDVESYDGIVTYEKHTDTMTALMRSCLNTSSSELTQMLIDAGANLNLQDRYGNTALIYAARTGQLDKVKMLLSYGCKYSIENFKKTDALKASILNGQTDVQIFIKAHIKEKEQKNRTRLNTDCEDRGSSQDLYSCDSSQKDCESSQEHKMKTSKKEDPHSSYSNKWSQEQSSADRFDF